MNRFPPVAILVVILAGCAKEPDHVACYPVKGSVLVGDQPTGGVMVKFYNSKNPADVDAAQPYATTDDKGEFTLSTFDPDDGAPADDYVVVLLLPEGSPSANFPVDRFGNSFTDPSKTPFRVTVKAEPNQIPPFKVDPAVLKKPKPKQTQPSADPGAPG